MPGSRVLDGQVTGVQQAIGAPKGRPGGGEGTCASSPKT